MGLEALDDNDDFQNTVISNRPEAVNLINIFCAIENISKREVLEKFSGKNFSILKDDLADHLISKIVPIGKEMKRMIEDISYLESILNKGAEKAEEHSQKNLLEII